MSSPLNLFDQFISPSLLGFPLLVLAIIIPWALIPKISSQSILLTSLILFIVTLNIMGLLPYSFTPTTHLPLNLALAFPL
ncbi:ATP synthase subunit a [Austrofundulus limnaeus]|uniref:ATP synthase subunit a n=1 Tax=Austrofundulus limnaeus TaxID=52670 RepID=A0A2I4AJS9_AUSLI|nr:PREDICTED: ATP synthase subunit a-like [Austrofundulus limnaeus]